MKKIFKICLTLAIFLSSAKIATAFWPLDLFFSERQSNDVVLGGTVIYPYQGGTGTSTPPSYSQLLLGNLSGGYDLVSLTAGSNVTITTTTNSVTIASTGGGGGGDPALTSTSTDLTGATLVMNGTIKTATGTPFSLYVGGDIRNDGNATTTGTSYLGGNVLVNGNITFNTPGSQSLIVGAGSTNAPVFLYGPNTNIGMFFDSAVDNAFEFTDTAGATVFQIKALTGNTLSSGVLDINGTGHNDFEGYLTLAAANTGMSAGDLKVGQNATTTNHFEADSTLYVRDSQVGIGTSTPISLFQTGSVLADTYFSIDTSGNATTSGWFNLGSTAGISELLTAGSLYASANVTTTAALHAPEICISNDCQTSWPAGGGTNDWQFGGSSNYITPTTSVGLIVNASSTFIGDFNISGNATTTGWLNLGGSLGISELLGSGSLYASGGVTTTAGFSANSTLYVVDGNVGIGTASPAEILYVNTAGSDFYVNSSGINIDSSGSAQVVVDRGGTSSNANVRFATGGGVSWIAGLPSNETGFAFRDSFPAANRLYIEDITSGSQGINQLYLDANGFVGVGTSTPAEKFQVGSILAGTYFLADSAGNATTSGRLYAEGKRVNPVICNTGNIFDATTTDELLRVGKYFPRAVTINEVIVSYSCDASAGGCASGMTFNFNFSTNISANVTPSTLFTAADTMTNAASTTPESFTSFNDATVPAGSHFWLDMATASTTQMTNVMATICYSEDS